MSFYYPIYRYYATVIDRNNKKVNIEILAHNRQEFIDKISTDFPFYIDVEILSRVEI